MNQPVRSTQGGSGGRARCHLKFINGQGTRYQNDLTTTWVGASNRHAGLMRQHQSRGNADISSPPCLHGGVLQSGSFTRTARRASRQALSGDAGRSTLISAACRVACVEPCHTCYLYIVIILPDAALFPDWAESSARCSRWLNTCSYAWSPGASTFMPVRLRSLGILLVNNQDAFIVAELQAFVCVFLEMDHRLSPSRLIHGWNKDSSKEGDEVDERAELSHLPKDAPSLHSSIRNRCGPSPEA